MKNKSGRSVKAGRRKCVLSLYIVGQKKSSMTALNNLQLFCKRTLNGKYTFEVIDLLKSPHLARERQIIAVPTLVRTFPQPTRNIIGDLSNTERMLAWLSS
jgi:circadian clock protein KaiB